MKISVEHCGKGVAFIVAKIEEKSDGIYVYDNTGFSIRLSASDTVYAYIEDDSRLVINHRDLFRYFVTGKFSIR